MKPREGSGEARHYIIRLEIIEWLTTRVWHRSGPRKRIARRLRCGAAAVVVLSVVPGL